MITIKEIEEIREDYPELKSMTFEKLWEMLLTRTFEQVVRELNDEDDELMPVECIDNDVFEDDDLYMFLTGIGAEIHEYIEDVTNDNKPDDSIIIRTIDGIYYQLPYREIPNRFDDDLPNENIINFDPNEILDVSEYY